ncbi:MAG TPA: DUF1524 domain-containing protein, partial [Bacilli bacterium]|nr:DUF1524 domain-containing protein [Bacilli bacterium]
PGVNALRTPIYAEMIKIVNSGEVTFEDYKFDSVNIIKTFDNYGFYNRRPITKSMLTWWAFKDNNQKLISLEDVFEIEHIYAKNRQDMDQSLSNKENVELLGNKILLEKRINIRASDYRFSDKKKYYKGFTTEHGITKVGTQIYELIKYANDDILDFSEKDIFDRNKTIVDSFLHYLEINNLIKS